MHGTSKLPTACVYRDWSISTKFHISLFEYRLGDVVRVNGGRGWGALSLYFYYSAHSDNCLDLIFCFGVFS